MSDFTPAPPRSNTPNPLRFDANFLRDVLDGVTTNRQLLRKYPTASVGLITRIRRGTDKAQSAPPVPGVEVSAGRLDMTSPSEGTFTNVVTEGEQDWDHIFKHFDLDPAVFEVDRDTVKMSKWQQSKRLDNGDRDTIWLHSYSASFKRIDQKAEEEFASVLERVKGFAALPAPENRARQNASLVIAASDLQIGKVDWNGGSVETEIAALNSFATAAEFAKDFRPAEICITDPGDIIENMFNTPSQLATNDLSVDRQIELGLHIMLTGVQMLAPLAPRLLYSAVSSNHGAVRTGPKMQAADAHADYGLAIARMVRRALQINPAAFSHVGVQTPEPHMESLSFSTSGSCIGLVHSHQASSPDKIGDWWKGQTHGNMPTAPARILIAGHWHSLRYYQTGDAKHIFVAPSSDRGSSWFTNLKGDSSTPGMLMFTTRDNEWDHLRVI